MNIHVGNVPYAATEEDLEKLFSEYGQVTTATIIRDRYDGRSKGFGFVEMENQEEGEQAIEALNGQEMMGRPLKVNPARPREQRRQDRLNRPVKDESPQKRKPSRDVPEESSPTQKTGEFGPATHFHNPYTFVPTPPRPSDGFAGDFNPLDHGLDHASLKDNLWTGHIPIKLTTVTPLVILKGDSRKEDSTEEPYDVYSRIPESSLRGMLRSAYEVVTNSRYSSFRNNDRLAYRMATSQANILIPTIIKEDIQTGELKACFYTGSSHPTNSGSRKTKRQRGQSLALNQIKEAAMYTALLPRYKKIKTTYQRSNEEPKTGDEVYAEIVLCGSGSYLYWQTSRIWLKSDCQSKPIRGSVPHSWDMRKPYRDSNGKHIIEVVEGTVLITNENIDSKGNERIFFYHNTKTQQEVVLTDDHKKDWKALIKNYRDVHPDDDIYKRKDMNDIPKEPWEVCKKNRDTTEYGWSPHLYHRENKRDRWGRDTYNAMDLQDGTMAYARCKIDDKTGTIKEVLDLFPVMISRELYEKSPEDLLDESLRPAEKLDDLSPADRLFGWTPQGQSNDGGYKSRIRVVCEGGERPEILESFDDPLPLTILGQPKPEQGRFYVAKDENGTPQNGVSKQKAGYDKNGKKQLRGRKHYWHHKGLETGKDKAKDYWDPFNDQDQEYIRKNRIEDTQNRSVKGWIKPEKKFKASLYVQNLQPKEVGALLWLLSLPDKYYYRLGYGKPLGFGSVKIEIDRDLLENGCLPLGNYGNWKTYYANLNATPPEKLDEEKQNDFVELFITSTLRAYQLPEEEENQNSQTFKELPFIKGFLRVLQGPNEEYRIHYPRKKPVRDPAGKNFEWFMENERGDRYRDGKELGLPDVNGDDQRLPYTPSDPKVGRR